MINHQPPERIQNDNVTLSIQEIFHTIQGEGPFTGAPAIFIRFAGCNLQCPMCDTDYTSARRDIAVQDIIESCKQLSESGLVVITGGEPFRQRRINYLVTELIQAGYYVQIETNGTLPSNLGAMYNRNFETRSGAYIVISPKTPHINQQISSLASAFKYVLKAGQCNPTDGLPDAALGYDHGAQLARPPATLPKHRIYIQPLDEGAHNPVDNSCNLAATVETCMLHGYNLQLQIHKIINMR